ncbi:MAG: carbon-nitrogen hydrolase family protein [Gordonia sp. (in: high G+C Gram-positive bacteria)]
MRLQIALAQVTSGYDVTHNLSVIEHNTRRAADRGARVVVFPEAMMHGFGRPLAPIAQPLDGPWANGVRAIAARNNVTVIAGMFTPAAGGRVHNTLLITGDVETSYDKIHLYDAFGYRESDEVTPGITPVTFTVDGVSLGVATCFDLRFPALFQDLALQGADAIAVPASWGRGEKKLDQWKLLTQARAADSTSYVLACDQPDGTRSHGPLGVGHSRVAGPDGSLLASLGAPEGVLVVELDTDHVDAVRQSITVLQQRPG